MVLTLKYLTLAAVAPASAMGISRRLDGSACAERASAAGTARADRRVSDVHCARAARGRTYPSQTTYGRCVPDESRTAENQEIITLILRSDAEGPPRLCVSKTAR